ncbi:MAG: hypothetical protein V3T23_11805, partial [Nitrososphaerales archaeon]
EEESNEGESVEEEESDEELESNKEESNQEDQSSEDGGANEEEQASEESEANEEAEAKEQGQSSAEGEANEQNQSSEESGADKEQESREDESTNQEERSSQEEGSREQEQSSGEENTGNDDKSKNEFQASRDDPEENHEQSNAENESSNRQEQTNEIAETEGSSDDANATEGATEGPNDANINDRNNEREEGFRSQISGDTLESGESENIADTGVNENDSDNPILSADISESNPIENSNQTEKNELNQREVGFSQNFSEEGEQTLTSGFESSQLAPETDETEILVPITDGTESTEVHGLGDSGAQPILAVVNFDSEVAGTEINESGSDLAFNDFSTTELNIATEVVDIESKSPRIDIAVEFITDTFTEVEIDIVQEEIVLDIEINNSPPPADDFLIDEQAPPIDLLLEDETPEDQPPIDEPPVEEPPVDEPPIDETPIDEIPIDEIPIDEPPIDEPPIDEPPIDETPIDETPLEEPTEEGLIIDEEIEPPPPPPAPPPPPPRLSAAEIASLDRFGSVAVGNFAFFSQGVASNGASGFPLISDSITFPLAEVLRQPNANLSNHNPDVANLGGRISWGEWLGNISNPVLIQIDANNAGSVVPIQQSVFWATVLPSDITLRSGTSAFGTDLDFLGASNFGPISAIYSSFDVDFDSGAVMNGRLLIELPGGGVYDWDISFDGNLDSGASAGLVSFNILPASSFQGGFDNVGGIFDGIFS